MLPCWLTNISIDAADETQTPGSIGETPSLVEPQTLTGDTTVTAPDFDHGVAAVNSRVTSSRSDTDMDISKPQSPGEQNMAIHEPSMESQPQSDTPAQTGVESVNGIARPCDSTYSASVEHIPREEVDTTQPRDDDNESQDSADADVSMQTSPAESPSSDDESYEPQPTQISDNQGALIGSGNVHISPPEQGVGSTTNVSKDEQVVDKDPFEPSPVETDVRVIQSNLEDTNGEVVLGQSRQRKLLTIV